MSIQTKYIDNNSNKVILYSHGFGVAMDSRGMFTDIAKELPLYDHLMFNYCDFKENGDSYVGSLTEQAERFLDTLEFLRAKKYAEINVITHSFGIAVLLVLNPAEINHLIVLAPPVRIDKESHLKRMQSKPGAIIDLHGYTIRPRADGSTTYIHHSFYDSLSGLDFYREFNQLKAKQISVITALQDEALEENFTKAKATIECEHIQIAADHNFRGPARAELITRVSGIFSC